MWGVVKMFTSGHSKGGFDRTPRTPPGYGYAVVVLVAVVRIVLVALVVMAVVRIVLVALVVMAVAKTVLVLMAVAKIVLVVMAVVEIVRAFCL